MTNDELTDAAVKQFNAELGRFGYREFSRDEFLEMGNVEISLSSFKVMCDTVEKLRDRIKELEGRLSDANSESRRYRRDAAVARGFREGDRGE